VSQRGVRRAGLPCWRASGGGARGWPEMKAMLKFTACAQRHPRLHSAIQAQEAAPPRAAAAASALLLGVAEGSSDSQQSSARSRSGRGARHERHCHVQARCRPGAARAGRKERGSVRPAVLSTCAQHSKPAPRPPPAPAPSRSAAVTSVAPGATAGCWVLPGRPRRRRGVRGARVCSGARRPRSPRSTYSAANSRAAGRASPARPLRGPPPCGRGRRLGGGPAREGRVGRLGRGASGAGGSGACRPPLEMGMRRPRAAAAAGTGCSRACGCGRGARGAPPMRQTRKLPLAGARPLLPGPSLWAPRPRVAGAAAARRRPPRRGRQWEHLCVRRARVRVAGGRGRRAAAQRPCPA